MESKSQEQTLQELLNLAYQLEQNEGYEFSEEYIQCIKSIADIDPLNYNYIDKYALALAQQPGKIEVAQEQ